MPTCSILSQEGHQCSSSCSELLRVIQSICFIFPFWTVSLILRCFRCLFGIALIWKNQGRSSYRLVMNQKSKGIFLEVCKYQPSFWVLSKYSERFTRLTHLWGAGASSSVFLVAWDQGQRVVLGIFSVKEPNMRSAFSTTQRPQRNCSQ